MAGLPFVESKVAYVNGSLVPVEEARISVFDRGFLYGDGIYETLGVRNGRAFKLDEHLNRLLRSSAAIKLQLPLTQEELRVEVLRTIAANGYPDAYVRILASRGVSFPVIDTRAATNGASLVILVHSRRQPPEMSGFFGGDGLRVQIVSIRKTPSVALDPRVKTLNYLNQILARLEATEAGADEALLLDMNGFVAEGAGDNVFAVQGQTLVTPGPQEILVGVTRGTVIELAAEVGLVVEERRMTSYDFYTADEAFISSTYGGVLPIASVNGRTIGTGERPGLVTAELLRRYEELLRTSGVPAVDAGATAA